MLPLLVVQHVEWERPHRIGHAIEAAGLHVVTANVLEGAELPPVADVCGAVFMGGPMGVSDQNELPGLTEELRWLERALHEDLPLLGVCLGSQLLATALGAEVVPGERPEIGWHEVEILETSDPLVGGLAPQSTVLHWHGDVFEPPSRAQLLARSNQTPCQAFRHGNAWGLLFHAEADAELTTRWLIEPAMRAEAEAALGLEFETDLLAGAQHHERELVAGSTPGFDQFASLAAARATLDSAI